MFSIIALHISLCIIIFVLPFLIRIHFQLTLSTRVSLIAYNYGNGNAHALRNFTRSVICACVKFHKPCSRGATLGTIASDIIEATYSGRKTSDPRSQCHQVFPRSPRGSRPARNATRALGTSTVSVSRARAHGELFVPVGVCRAQGIVAVAVCYGARARKGEF